MSIQSGFQSIGEGKRYIPATKIVGTATNGWSSQQCDYLCTGSNDTTIINNAITSLPTNGGRIILLDGTYNISGRINIAKKNVILMGNGPSTILNQKAASCEVNITGADVTLYNFCISSSTVSVKHNNVILGNSSTVDNLTFIGNNSAGNNISISTSNFNIINSFFKNECCAISGSGSYGLINNNIIDAMSSRSNRGIYLYSGTFIDCSNNNISRHSDAIAFENMTRTNITGNNLYGSTCGIAIISSSNSNIISQNNINDTTSGINYTGGSFNVVTQNIIKRGNGYASDYNETQYTIYKSGNNSNSLFTLNYLMGKDITQVSQDSTSTFSNIT